jgi:tyrosine-protein phosphatase YwqE
LVDESLAQFVLSDISNIGERPFGFCRTLDMFRSTDNINRGEILNRFRVRVLVGGIE